MSAHSWIEEFPAAVTVCDVHGIILEMNAHSAEVFTEDGGRGLIGSNVLDCHPEPARTKLVRMLASGQTNVYTVETKGVNKLIYQAPWYQGGQYAGFVELELELPIDLPHFIRD